jgi:mono/diheme cytochrome c family protein
LGRLAGGLFVVSLLLVARPAAADKVCTKSCKNLQENCVGAARATFGAEKPACTDKTCKRAAKKRFKTRSVECRAVRKACKPCCDLGGVNECAEAKGAVIAAQPQVGGDPVHGRELLLSGDYMTCGIPLKVYDSVPGLIAGGFGGPADAPRIPDRAGRNADLPFFLNTFTAPDGAEVVNANCLMCHGGTFDGQLIVGLGNATADFTAGAGGGITGVPITDDLVDLLGLTEIERAQLQKIASRGGALGPLTKMRTIGMNPAELFAVILMVHHDRDTLAWSDVPLTPLVPVDHDGAPIADPRVTSDPPPWWRAHKKHALFYNGMARGDHRGTMALATSVCVDDVARAQVVDEEFKDIQAFISAMRAPTYTRSIDAALVDQGRVTFARDCAGCHGSYAASDDEESYPNLIIPLDVIGTDPVVAEAGVVHSPELVSWYNGSFYGGITQMVPNDPFPGYMPPPLDGIWATAPFFHNGSVPTVELVLNSHARPTYWARTDLDSTNFDEAAMGWPYVVHDGPPDALPPAERKMVFDTTQWSQSNAGHTYGDHLTDAERRAVIEYLKTL